MYKFFVVATLIFALASNAVSHEPIGKKEPGLSAVLSGVVLSGTGQFYNGENGKGVMFIVSEMIGWGLMVAGAEDNVELLGESVDVDDDDSAFGVGALLFFTSRLASAIDAGVSARQINRGERVSLRPIGRGAMLSVRF